MVFALVDCNNFYASCERLFRPDLATVPIVVLSNNDGCIIARSNEAKALGIKMGEPFFQVRRLCEQRGVKVFSSNYTLYGDISGRIMSHLHEFTPAVEVYSIDEAFLQFNPKEDLDCIGRLIRARILQCQGVPVSVGLAPTKTLAKVAAEIAKTSTKANGVLNLVDSPWLDTALERIPVYDVWGVGRRIAPVLERRGIKTAKDLRDIDQKWAQKKYGVTLVRTIRELQGIPCIELEQVPSAKKSIMTSRSFGATVDNLAELKERVAGYAARTGEKLREDGLHAKALMVFAHTNPFRKNEQQYYGRTVTPLVTPTSNSDELIQAALHGLEMVYQEGYNYHKAGVMALDITLEQAFQQSLIAQSNHHSAQAMAVMDKLNSDYGTGVVRFAVEGTGPRYRMLRENRSPKYTTDWDEIKEVG